MTLTHPEPANTTMNKFLVSSLEAIDFQRNSTLIKEMELQFDSVMKDPTKGTIEKVEKAIAAIAKKQTGMTIRFHFQRDNVLNACVYTPLSSTAHPMRAHRIMEAVSRSKTFMSEKELFKGTVDIKTGKVSGIYAEVPVDVMVSTMFLHPAANAGIRADHLAAIVAHELGHALMFFYFTGKAVISNLAVAEIIKKQQSGASSQEIAEVIRVIELKTGYSLRDLGTITDQSDPFVIQQIITAQHIEKIRSELGTRFYDRRAFEFAADQFVARHGGALLIVEALDIINRKYPGYTAYYSTNSQVIAASIMGYVKAIGYGTASALAMALTPIAGPEMVLISLILGFTAISQFFSAPHEDVYDDPKNRFLAMRRELIAYGKEPDLPREVRADIAQQIMGIDEIIASLGTLKFFGPKTIYPWLHGALTGRTGQMNFQRELENLANNRLFEASNVLLSKV